MAYFLLFSVASPHTQRFDADEDFISLTNSSIYADPPEKNINSFFGILRIASQTPPLLTSSYPLSIDNVLWANTVVASGTSILAVVIYTGRDARASLNTNDARLKVGLLDSEINNLTKVS